MAFVAHARADAPAANRTFTSKAAAGGFAEVQSGWMATQNAGFAIVKAFGQRMVTDHTQANEALMAIARKQGLLVLPTKQHNRKQDCRNRRRERRSKGLCQ